jgi:N-acetylglucosamine kinase-like BadF-type ATPase
MPSIPNNGRKRRPHQLFAGVDGGGTTTHVALMNESREIIGEGKAGPSNPLRVGVETAVHNIAVAIDSACDDANVLRGEIGSATLGLAGVRRQDLRDRVRASFVEQLRIKKTTVLTDAEIALFGTAMGKPALVVIAGTGSICLGKNERGQTAIAGGWGPIAGDEGGGRGIAEEALHRIAKASDGRGPATSLTELASEYFRASGPENLIVAIYSPQMDNTRIAGFARFVVRAAQDGDQVAKDIISEAGSELGVAACAVIRKLGLQNRKIPIGCVGGIFNAGSLLTDPMIGKIHAVAPKAFLTTPMMPPAHAAAVMSLENDGHLPSRRATKP